MAGQKLTILGDFGPSMSKAFLDLHGAYLADHPYDLAHFTQEACAYFSLHIGDISAHNQYFNAFTIVWRSLVNRGDFDGAESIWEDVALPPALLWERQNPGTYIHKGTPYYFWGMTAIIRGDIDKGYALMHQALEEDARTSVQRFPPTPAFAFATLDYPKVDQAFRSWVLSLAEYVHQHLVVYQHGTGRALTLEKVHGQFLSSPPNLEAVFLLSYCVGRLFLLSHIPEYALQSQFAGQLQSNLFFDMTLVIDDAIGAKNPKVGTFIDQMTFLSKRAGLRLNKARLIHANAEFKRDFDATLSALLSGAFKFADGFVPAGLEIDLLAAYAIRNRGAHNVASSPTIWHRFVDLRRSLFNTLFLTVEVLY